MTAVRVSAGKWVWGRTKAQVRSAGDVAEGRVWLQGGEGGEGVRVEVSVYLGSNLGRFSYYFHAFSFFSPAI